VKHGDTWRLVEGRGGAGEKSEYEGKEGVDEKVPILWEMSKGRRWLRRETIRRNIFRGGVPSSFAFCS
jgi:hypothetical protein